MSHPFHFVLALFFHLVKMRPPYIVLQQGHIVQTKSDFHVPTELFDERLGVLENLARKFDHINAFKDDVIGLHRVRASERWAKQSNNHALMILNLNISWQSRSQLLSFPVPRAFATILLPT